MRPATAAPTEVSTQRVPKSLLRATLAVLGGQHSYTAVDQQIYDLKQQGEVAVYPDQHPNADVQLRE